MKKILALFLTLLSFLLVACDTAPETPEETPPTVCDIHTFGDWQTVNEATCLAEGSEKRICTVCQFEEVRNLEITDHLYGEWETVVASTFYIRGTDTCKCIYCDKTKNRYNDRINTAKSKYRYKIENKYNTMEPRIYRTQGGCFDGVNIYQALISKNEEIAVILKKNVETNETIYSTPIPMGHANDITYNPKTNLIYVCSSNKQLYIYKADTLEFVRSITLPYVMSAISYNEHNNTYIGYSGGKNYYYDSSFNYISDFRLQKTQTTSQGMCSDEKYVYNLYCNYLGIASRYDTYIIIHDHNGSYINTIKVDIKNDYEPENISIIDGKMYILCPTVDPAGQLFEVLLP